MLCYHEGLGFNYTVFAAGIVVENKTLHGEINPNFRIGGWGKSVDGPCRQVATQLITLKEKKHINW